MHFTLNEHKCKSKNQMKCIRHMLSNLITSFRIKHDQVISYIQITMFNLHISAKSRFVKNKCKIENRNNKTISYIYFLMSIEPVYKNRYEFYRNTGALKQDFIFIIIQVHFAPLPVIRRWF